MRIIWYVYLVNRNKSCDNEINWFWNLTVLCQTRKSSIDLRPKSVTFRDDTADSLEIIPGGKKPLEFRADVGGGCATFQM
jgi:hypothetical protein